MASKVMVKMPVQAFAGTTQVKSKNGPSEVMPMPRNTDIRSPDSSGNLSTIAIGSVNSTPPVASPVTVSNGTGDNRVGQLEQNIKYLQEQHALMLTGLHHEIDCLRHRNRELQFQLVFVKGTNASTPSSPEDDKPKLYSNSPKVLNVVPLQVEILEKELGEMKIQLQESECRNVYLSAIVDEQKKKLERYERDRERERERGIQPDPELLRKLDDAESLIRRLRRENSDLRRENAAATVAASATVAFPQPQQQRDYHQSRNNGSRRRGGNGGNTGSSVVGGSTAGANPSVSTANVSGAGGGGANGQSYRPNWFPPLHTQNYWQQQNRPQASHVDSLPQLTTGGHHVVYPSQQGPMHGRRGGNSGTGGNNAGNNAGNNVGGGGGGGGNNNHYQYHPNGERKYRGNQPNRGQKSS